MSAPDPLNTNPAPTSSESTSPESPSPLPGGQTPATPNLLDLLLRPREFFMALSRQRPRDSRYVWLVLLTGVISGLYSSISQKPLQDALAGVPGLPGGGAGLVVGLLTTAFATLIMWLILWGLGHLGAGKEGRSAEVYGASFLPSLLVALILLPVTALFPLHVHLPPPNTSSLEGAALSKAIQHYSLALQKDVAGQPLSIIGKVLSYGAMAWQFYLAHVGFGVLTRDRTRALRGALIPLGIFLLLSAALWLLGKAASSLVGGGA